MLTLVGKPTSRVDGSLKVSGGARYTSDYHFPGMLYAVPVSATIARGKIASLSTAHADRMPGVRAVFHHRNFDKLYRTAPDLKAEALQSEQRPPLEDEVISYYGQYIALVVAETFEQARAAAAAVRVTYYAEPASVGPPALIEGSLKVESQRGDAPQAFSDAAIAVDETYATPIQTHSVIELHATVAVWQGDQVTLYETVQGVLNHQVVMTQRLGVEKEKLQVITRNLGSGFGGKISEWGNSCLAAVAAKRLKRPVKLVISRQQAFAAAGHRPRTEQRVRLGANKDGRLSSLQLDWTNSTSLLDDFVENCGEAAPYLYSTPNMRSRSGLAKRTVGAPTFMRGPGAVPGLFALESAIDELAIRLDMDPIALRQANEPTMDESTGLPFSSRHLTECLREGSSRFGWPNRNPKIGSMTRDGLVLGWGVAACAWGAGRLPCAVRVDLRADRSARLACGTQDIGTGTYTILGQIVAERLAIPLGKVDVVLGDSSLPAGPLSGGSLATASVIPATFRALDDATASLLASAARVGNQFWNNAKPTDLAFTAGNVHLKDEAPASGRPFAEVLQRAGLRSVSGAGQSDGTLFQKPTSSVHCFGAQFAEVTWQPEIARLRVSRIVSVIDSGRILNPKTGRNQIEGGVVMGIGMAIFEETRYDPRNGAPINSNLADYLLTSHADCPEIDVHFLEYPDLQVNELGAKGIGEIGMAGVAPAIANAVHHATGIRVRQLPIRIEDLLGAQRSAGRI